MRHLNVNRSLRIIEHTVTTVTMDNQQAIRSALSTFFINPKKRQTKIAADDIHKYFFIVLQRKYNLMFSSESSAWQRIHMKKSSLIFFER